MDKGRRIFFGILLVAYIAAVAYLCFSTLQHLPHVSRYIWGIPTDKFVHFVMFLPFPVLTYLTFCPITRKLWKVILCLLAIFLVGCCFAASTEYIQKFLSYRTADLMDFKADTMALTISSTFVFILDLIIAFTKRADN